QPRPVMFFARAKSRCWLPPQPWTKRMPGIFAPGVRMVPEIDWLSTAISMLSLLTLIRLNLCEFGNESHVRVVALVKHVGPCCKGSGAVNFVGRGANRL